MLREAIDRWTHVDTSELYGIARWGSGYFSVGENGHLLVHPSRDPDRSIDMKELIDRLGLRGLDAPILLRFNGILEDRVHQLHAAFAKAMQDHHYQADYRCVFPIKVNPQRQVVEKILHYGRPHGFGLEAGSKPELLAVVALTEDDVPIICNGFKDAEFIEMAMLAQRVGRNVFPVVEKLTELPMILDHADRVGVRPQIGMRVKLAAAGAGRWQQSGGYRSKFGLTVTEMMKAFDLLQRHEMLDCFKLIHFHLGSQITNIRHIKSALIEAARIYADLVKRNAGLELIDVGGGLGVDYDGSQTSYESSVNYSMQEYANDVVYHLQTVCDDAGVPHPRIISESGRAIAAYHSVLVSGVVGSSAPDRHADVPSALPEHAEQPLHTLWETYALVNSRNILESFHDAQQAFEMALNLFTSGYLPLEQRSLAENLFFAICDRIQQFVHGADEHVPEELRGLDRLLASTYFCNFSLFQSIPDSWAIKQLFPVMPIQRLDERPTVHSVLGDVTCDSDGKIDQFIDLRDVKPTLPLHKLDDSAYYVGTFLVGAYQEILGDLHNLFGDTNTVHVDLLETGEIVLENIVKGQTVHEVLQYAQYDGRDLIHRLQAAVEKAVHGGLLGEAEAGRFVKFYEEGLNGYTYLENSSLENASAEQANLTGEGSPQAIRKDTASNHDGG